MQFRTRDAATRAFELLVRHFGCRIERTAHYGCEAYVIFKCADLTVTVNDEPGDEPWVAVEPAGEKVESSLKQSLRRSGLEPKAPSDDTLSGRVANQAEMLRRWLAESQHSSGRVT